MQSAQTQGAIAKPPRSHQPREVVCVCVWRLGISKTQLPLFNASVILWLNSTRNGISEGWSMFACVLLYNRLLLVCRNIVAFSTGVVSRVYFALAAI